MEIKIKKKINWSTLLILIIYEFFVLIFIFITSYIAILEIVQDWHFSEFIIISVMLILLGLFVLDKILWQVNGSEIIIMDNENLVIQKKGKIFTKQNIISLFEIDSIEQKDYKTALYTLFVKMMGMRDGKICIEYLGRNTYVGQSLTNSKALECVEDMNELLSNYKKTTLQKTP